MLHFTKLKLQGFKSFVDKTELLINPGMTGIIGPNGCGKSNLVEALRWVMGETSAKRMRGNAMDDVIFGGTTLRPARNIAEVVLMLDNSSRSATAEFNQDETLEIVRQIEREGGSDYRVNGRPVRQRDVQLLFADLASGAHSTSMVGQGQIDALIRAKPQDRRQILEEASGTAGLHARRHEAELKLKAAEQNLNRLDDVLNALETQLRSLKNQVRQASRYRNLAEHIRRTEAALFHLRWLAAQQQMEASQLAFTASDAQVNALLATVTRLTTQRTEDAAGLPALRQSESVAAAVVQRLVIAREQIEAEERRFVHETTQIKQRHEQARADKAREEGLQRDAVVAIERLSHEQQELQSRHVALTDGMPDLQKDVAAITATVTALETALEERTQHCAAIQARQGALQRSSVDLAQRRALLQERNTEFSAQQTKLLAELAARPDLALAQAMIQACEQDVARRQDGVAQAESSQKEAEQERAAAREAAKKQELTVTKLRAESETIAALLNNVAPGGEQVIDRLQVAPGLEAALAVALGEALMAPVDETAAAHWRVLPLYQTMPPLPDGCTALHDMVQAPAALQRALRQVGIVVDDADGKRLQEQLVPGQILVSRSGWAWRWDGYTVSPAAKTPAALRLQQRNRLVALGSEIEGAVTELNRLQAALLTLEQQCQQAQQQAGEARVSLQQAHAALNDARQHHARYAQAEAAALSRQKALEEALHHLQQDVAGLLEKSAEVEAEIAALPDISAMQSEQDAIKLELAEQRQVFIERRGRLDHAVREAQGLQARLTQCAGDLQSWHNRKNAAGNHLSSLVGRLTELEVELAVLAEKPTMMQQQRQVLLSELQSAESVRSAAADTLLLAEKALAEVEHKLKQEENALTLARENRVRSEAAIAAAEEHSRVLTEAMTDKLECAPDGLLSIAQLNPAEPMPDISALEQQLVRYVRERENMGPVNLRAEIEAETVEADLNTLNREKTDLTEAIAKLRHGIGQLNKEARERLNEAFQKVDVHFQELFKRLFGGGKAHLQLLDADDPANAGLEIYAAPPGKKVQILSLLSGGERSLTALALLFAVFLTNPSPICVLDEAEAALDEANVDRFCSLVADIAKETSTRFLVITHQRLTMARMDRLYGVTMSEKGISQLVSVDLSQAEAVRDGVVPDDLSLAAAE